MMRYIITAIIFLFSSFLNIADGQSVIRGRITDKGTGDPITGAYIIYGKYLGTTSDNEGYYIFNSGAVKQSVTFQFAGYESITKEVVSPANDTLVLNIELEMKILEIDQVVISADKIEERIAELTVSTNIIKPSLLSENHITDAQEIINRTSGKTYQAAPFPPFMRALMESGGLMNYAKKKLAEAKV